MPVRLCVCPLDYSKSYKRIWMKFLEEWGVIQGNIDHILAAIQIPSPILPQFSPAIAFSVG